MRWLVILLLVAMLYSCVPNDSTADYRKVDVVLCGIDNANKRTLILAVDGRYITYLYNRDTFQVDWLTIVRVQNDRPHFILLADEKNNLYHL